MRYLLCSFVLGMLACTAEVVNLPDNDEDGWCAEPATRIWDPRAFRCEAPKGVGDCDDEDARVNPDVVEGCDGTDQNCDGEVLSVERDLDGDGVLACSEIADCDDRDNEVAPGLPEVCDGKDNDCSGIADDGLTFDADDDGSTSLDSCEGDASDCDDADPTIAPGLTEVCDSKDNDCSGTVDDVIVLPIWYTDADGDGYGNVAAATISSCDPGVGWASRIGDCDDGDTNIFPTALERCNVLDDDCNGLVDDSTLWVNVVLYADGDGDGHGGIGGAPAVGCPTASGYSELQDDCDDLDSSVSPTRVEVCDGLDQDCDTEADEGCPVIERFEVRAYRGEPLLDLDRSSGVGMSCPTADDNWTSSAFGTGPNATDGTLAYLESTLVSLEWEVQALDPEVYFEVSPDFVGEDLGPFEEEGRLEFTPDATDSITLVAVSDGFEVRYTVDLLELESPYPRPSPGGCSQIPLDSELFTPNEVEPYRGADLLLENRGLDLLGGNAACEFGSFSDPIIDPADFWIGESASRYLVFDAVDGAPRPRVFTLQTREMVLPADAELWLTYELEVEGGVYVRPRATFREHATTPYCEAGDVYYGGFTGETLGERSMEVDLGAANESRAGFLSRPAMSGYTRATLGFEVFQPPDESGTVWIQGLEAWCCGPGCGAAVDPDHDGYCLWCPGGMASNFDCDEFDSRVNPGAPDGGPSMDNDCRIAPGEQETCPTPR